jgi:hypothetical protein
MDEVNKSLERLRRLVASDVHQPIADGVFVPDGTQPYHTGTTVPVIGSRFARRSDGLLLPDKTLGQRLADRVLRYMTWSVLSDSAPSEGVAPRLLQAHPVDEVVSVIGAILNVLVRRNLDEGQRWAVETFIKPDARRRAAALLEDGWIFLAPQALLAAAKVRLGLDDGQLESDEELDAHVVGAVLAIAEELTATRADEEMWGDAPAWLVIESLQNQYFNAKDDVGAVLARGRRLRELMRHRNPELARVLHALFEEVTGSPVDAVELAGLALYTGTQDHASVPPTYFDDLRYPNAVRASAVAVLVGDAATLREEVEAESARLSDVGFDWGYNAFRKYPALRRSDGPIFVIHPGYLIDRCAIDAFELKTRVELRRRAAEGDAEAKRLDGATGELMGMAYEDYVGESLHAQLPQIPGGAQRVWTEVELQEKWPKVKHCDFVADYGGAIVCIEVVSKQLVEQTYAAGSREALERDLGALVDKKAKQLHSTVSLILARGSELGLAEVSVPIFPAVLSTAGFPWNPLIAAVVVERLANADLLQQARVRPLRIMTIRNLEEVEALVEDSGPSLGELLVDAHEIDEDGFALDQIIDARGHRLRRPDRLNPLWLDVFRDLALAYGLDPDGLDMSPDDGE